MTNDSIKDGGRCLYCKTNPLPRTDSVAQMSHPLLLEKTASSKMCLASGSVFLQLHHCMSATIKFPKKRKQICKACPTNDCEGQIDYLRFVRTKKSFVNEADESKSTSPFVLSVYELLVTHSFILYTLHCYPALLRSLRSLNQLKSGE